MRMAACAKGLLLILAPWFIVCTHFWMFLGRVVMGNRERIFIFAADN